jgi:DNA (cytosine-5)-methyltransferase 3A
MNVLSLFDGMSGGQIALTELDIPIDKYYASEIDKYAMQFTIQNFPDTIQVGDVRELDINKLDKIDLLIGGSPCQSLSMAGKRKGLSTKEGIEIFDLEMYLELKENGFEFEGQSYLFWEYIRIYNDLLERGDNPKFFLENVEMGKKWESVFNDILGRKGIHINSALVSAQNRRRIYWTDIHDDIPQPEDRGILLRDILEEEVDEKYFLSDKMIECLKGRVKTDNDPICVAMPACLTPRRTEYGKQIRKEYEAGIVKEQRKNIQQLEPREDRKTNCLTTVQKDNLIIVSGTIRTFRGKHFREIKSGKSCTLMARARNDGNAQPCVIIGTPNIADITIPNKYIKKNIRSIDDKAHTLLATSHKGAMVNGMTLVDNGNFRIRRLTPTECARLQTVPEWYVWDGISDTQRYKMLGNGWNIETIKHIFKYIEK